MLFPLKVELVAQGVFDNSVMQGKVVVVAIGATAVGSIVQLNKPGDDVKKGDCFGYFQFGGSTCIMLTQKGRMQFDDDLLETAVRELPIHSWILSAYPCLHTVPFA